MPPTFPFFRSQLTEFTAYWDVFVRAAFCLYYLPVIALAVALTHSCLESTVYVLVIPTLRRLEEISVCMVDVVVTSCGDRPCTVGGRGSVSATTTTTASVDEGGGGVVIDLIHIAINAVSSSIEAITNGGACSSSDNNNTPPPAATVTIADLSELCGGGEGTPSWDAAATAWAVMAHQRGVDLFNVVLSNSTVPSKNPDLFIKQEEEGGLFPSTSTTTDILELLILKTIGILFISTSVLIECVKLCLVLLPQACIAMSAVVIGHKLIKGLTEAMVDSYSRLEDGKDYPLLAARLRFVTHSRRRWLVLVVVLVLGLLSIGAGMLLDTKDRFAKGHVEVATAIWLTSLVCGTYIAVTALQTAWGVLRAEGANGVVPKRRFQLLPPPDAEWNRYAFAGRQSMTPPPFASPVTGNGGEKDQQLQQQQQRQFPSTSTPPPLMYVPPIIIDSNGVEVIQFSTFFTGLWWRGHIHRVRHLAMVLLLAFGAGWAVTEGPMTSIIRSTELMMFLNIPHIFGFVTLTIASSIIYKLHSVWWCLRHWRVFGLWVTLAMTPHAVMIWYAIVYVVLGYAKADASTSSSTSTTMPSGQAYYTSLTVLASMLMLLFFKGVQLAREFDVMPRMGRVRWVEVLPVVIADTYEEGGEGKGKGDGTASSPSSPTGTTRRRHTLSPSAPSSVSADIAHPARYIRQDSTTEGLESELLEKSPNLHVLATATSAAKTKKKTKNQRDILKPALAATTTTRTKIEWYSSEDIDDSNSGSGSGGSRSSRRGEEEDDDFGSSFVSPSAFDMSVSAQALSEPNSPRGNNNNVNKKRSWREMLSRSQSHGAIMSSPRRRMPSSATFSTKARRRRDNGDDDVDEENESNEDDDGDFGATWNDSTHGGEKALASVTAPGTTSVCTAKNNTSSGPTTSSSQPPSSPTSPLSARDVANMLKYRICRPVPASYAVALEDAFERQQEEVGVVGLDISVSLAKMELYRRGQIVPSNLVRTEVSREDARLDRLMQFRRLARRRYGRSVITLTPVKKHHGTTATKKLSAAKGKLLLSEIRILYFVWQLLIPFISDTLRSKILPLEQLFVLVDTVRSSYLFYSLPRLFLMNASDNLSGRRYSNARVAIRTFISTLIMIFLGLTVMVVAQTSFPFLHPAPVTVTYQQHHHHQQSSSTNKNGVTSTANLKGGEGEDTVMIGGGGSSAASSSYSAVIDHLLLRLEIKGSSSSPQQPLSSQQKEEEEQNGETRNKKEPPHNVLDEEEEEDQYPDLCRAVYGNNISVFEMAWFAMIPYLPHEQEMGTLLDFLNHKMGTNWRIVTGPSSSSSKAPHPPPIPLRNHRGYLTKWQGFVDFYCPDRDTHVVSVRGTDLTSSLDMIQDINMFFEAAFFQVVSSVVPGASLLPTSLVTDFIKLSSLTDTVSGSSAWSFLASSLAGTSPPLPQTPIPSSTTEIKDKKEEQQEKTEEVEDLTSNLSIEREYYLQVLAYVEGLKRQHRKQSQLSGTTRRRDRLLLTGHSLGGSIAHVVASRSGTRSIGFNNPGIVLAHKKFGIPDVGAIHRRTTSILATHDLIPLIGWQGGAMHYVECGAQVRELCHAMEFMLASLWRSCGSIRRRYPNISSVE